MSLSRAKVDVLIWVLIYIGMALFGLGLAVRRSDDGLGWGFVVAGIAVAAVGVLLVWIRSRMKEER